MRYLAVSIGGFLFAYICGAFIKSSFDVFQWSEFARTTMVIFGIYFSGIVCLVTNFMSPCK